MIGAVIGDIVGSQYEFNNIKSKDFELFTSRCVFTDDTVMTCCVAEALMRSWEKDEFATLEKVALATFQDIAYWYPYAGYGKRFWDWVYKNPVPYDSCGNGSAMRVSPVSDIAQSITEAEKLARAVTVVSHNHPQGILGAECTAVAGYLARIGATNDEILEYVKCVYYPDIKSVNEYRAETKGHGQELCQISVPQAMGCFYEGNSYEDVIRNCVSIGGDSDTVAAIAGGIAEHRFGVPEDIKEMGMRYLDRRLKDIVLRWEYFKKLFWEGNK